MDYFVLNLNQRTVSQGPVFVLEIFTWIISYFSMYSGAWWICAILWKEGRQKLVQGSLGESHASTYIHVFLSFVTDKSERIMTHSFHCEIIYPPLHKLFSDFLTTTNKHQTEARRVEVSVSTLSLHSSSFYPPLQANFCSENSWRTTCQEGSRGKKLKNCAHLKKE